MMFISYTDEKGINRTKDWKINGDKLPYLPKEFSITINVDGEETKAIQDGLINNLDANLFSNEFIIAHINKKIDEIKQLERILARRRVTRYSYITTAKLEEKQR